MALSFFQHAPYHQIGLVVSVDYLGFKHKGIISDRMIDGELTVISLSRAFNGLCEEKLSAFSQGRSVTIDGFLGKLSPHAVIQRARGMIGLTYNLFSNNCEHFVRHVHGVRAESPQVKNWLIVSGILGFLALVAKY